MRPSNINQFTANINIYCNYLDTHVERDYLIEHVYPKLKKYCKQQYGLDFQVL